MAAKTWRFIALILAALAMGMHFAHMLELSPKLQWDAGLYFPVQTSLYKLFGSIGPVIEIGALVVISMLAFKIRDRQSAFKLTLTSAGMILLALIVWAVFVMPANAHITQWLTTQTIPSDWMRWRDQWQYAQAAIFILHLIGFSSLTSSVIADTPDS